MRVLSGTTLESYHICAIVDGGRAYYIKVRNPEFRLPKKLHYGSDFSKSAWYAMWASCYWEIVGARVPIIMKGEIDRDYRVYFRAILPFQLKRSGYLKEVYTSVFLVRE